VRSAVFAVQEDIARTIVTSLRVPLGLKQGESLVSNRGIDPQLSNVRRARYWRIPDIAVRWAERPLSARSGIVSVIGSGWK
jgi:hypothetical protein